MTRVYLAPGSTPVEEESMSREHETNPPRPPAPICTLRKLKIDLGHAGRPARRRRDAAAFEDDRRRATVRARYIDCVQLHVDLREHFGRAAAEKAPSTGGAAATCSQDCRELRGCRRSSIEPQVRLSPA